MKRIAANYIYLSVSEIIRNGFIQIDEDRRVVAIGSLDVTGEIAGTRFLDGVILPFEPSFSEEEQELDLFDVLNSLSKGRPAPNSADGFWLLHGVSLANRVAGAGWKVARLDNFI